MAKDLIVQLAVVNESLKPSDLIDAIRLTCKREFHSSAEVKDSSLKSAMCIIMLGEGVEES